MKKLFLIPLCLLCFCAPSKTTIPTKPTGEMVNLDDNCKMKIEQMLYQEFNKKFTYFNSMKRYGNDTITAFYQDLESKEIKNNSIWVYLDNQCNILGKKIGTIYQTNK
jgi:hypothetical protein